MKRLLTGMLSLVLSGGIAMAQDYPSRAVSIISPYAAGGSGDIAARFIADGLTRLWNQPVTVENLTGGGTLIGSGRAAQAKPDGYTILVHGTSLTMVAAARKDMPFDVGTAFEPVSVISDTQFVLVVGPGVKATTIEEFIEEGKSREMMATTSGPGTSTHFANELLAAGTGIGIKNVHYKGGAEAVVDVAAGRADFYVATVTSAKTFLDSGQVRPLAVMGARRLEALPEVPTLAEKGIDAEVGLWWGALVPAGTPPDIIAKINADISRLMTTPEGIEYLNRQQATHPEMDVAAVKAFFDTELAKWKKVAEEQNITLE